MRRLLLLGAGFSRNWGGWLGLEAFEYLLGCPLLDEGGLRDLLWKHKRQGGFEAAIGELQQNFARRPGDPLVKHHLGRFQEAVQQMFADMDRGFEAITNFEFQGDRQYSVRSFLVRFDAIFTLNQDLLLERHYLNGNYVASESKRRWAGGDIPGMRALDDRNMAPRAEADFQVVADHQPYFKLHGSSNWIDESSGERLLIIGGDKAETIARHPILRWNSERFAEHLSAPDSRLVVMGYSFGDDHVNRIITKAAGGGQLRMFIINPLGVDVLDKKRNLAVYYPGELLISLGPQVLGASRRTLREIFGHDRVEHSKVMRFLATSNG